MIYFLQPGPGEPVKIGYVSEVQRMLGRMKELQPGNPYALQLVLLLPGDQRVEAKLHQIHSRHRLSGEWFDSRVLARHGVCPRCSVSMIREHKVVGNWINCGEGDEIIKVHANTQPVYEVVHLGRIRYATPLSENVFDPELRSGPAPVFTVAST